LPPLCAIPCTSESFTSYPRAIASPPRTLLVRSVPCPPTPTIIIFFVSIICHPPLPARSHQIYTGSHTVRTRYTWYHRCGWCRLHFLSWRDIPASYTCRTFYIYP